MYAPITNFARLFFSLESVKALFIYGLGYPTQPHGEKLHAAWALSMRIVPPFRVRIYKKKSGNFPNLVLALPSTLKI